MKKLLSLILAIAIIICAVPIGAFTLAVNAQTDGYYTYEVIDGSAIITDVDTSISGDITIPSILGGYTVTRINSYAFEECKSLVSISIPNSVTSIGDWAFSDCTKLTSINIPDGVTNIGDNVFSGTDYYSNENNWENNVLYVGNHLIKAKGSISGAYTINEGTLTLADEAFWGCKNLTSITFSDSVTSICHSVFYDCTKLKSIALGAGVTNIPERAFCYCKSLTSITVSDDNQNFCSIDGVLFNKNATTLMAYPAAKTNTTYIITDNVNSIGDSAFVNCKSLSSLTIPDSVIRIGVEAFEFCTSLTSVTISNSVTSIDDGTFYRCTSLTSITIPDNVTNIGDQSFSGCTSLTSITIPNAITSIGNMAFDYCENLTTVYYRGSEEDRAKITIGNDNTYLTDATWYYNSCINAPEHTYGNDCDADCNVCGTVRNNIHVYDDEEDTTCNICGFEKPKYISGNINNDTQINNKDLGLLMQFLNNWDVEIVTDAADVNRDGSVNNKDYGLLMQYLNNWDVELQ